MQATRRRVGQFKFWKKPQYRGENNLIPPSIRREMNIVFSKVYATLFAEYTPP